MNGPSPVNELLAAALMYAERGWPVAPLHAISSGACTCGKATCSSPGKHPRTKSGLTDATVDEAVIRGWWKTWPDAHIMVRCGPDAGIWVLDLDAGTDALDRVLAAAKGGEPWETLTARTGGGGEHRVYRLAPAEVAQLARLGVTLPTRNGIGGKGLDVRAEGGYIVAAPSGHVSGGAYAWLEDRPIAPAPDWLLKLVGKPVEARKSYTYTPPPRSGGAGTDEGRAKYGAAVLASACQRVAAASEGSRHNVLVAQSRLVGGYLASGRIPYPEALEALCVAGEAAGKPAKEVRAAVVAGLAYGQAAPCDIPDAEYSSSSSSTSSGGAPGAGQQQGGAGPQQQKPEPKAERLKAVRVLLARCLAELYAEGCTKVQRQAIARELAGSIDLLISLALEDDAEWATWCAAAGAAGGFSELLKDLRRAVAAGVAAWKAAKRKAAEDKAAESANESRSKILSRLSRGEEGRVKGSYANIVTILKLDPRWESLRMSELGNVVEVSKAEVKEGPATAEGCEWLRDSYGMDAGEVSVKSAIYAVAQGKAYSPVRNYLESVRPLGKGGGLSAIGRILPEILGITNADDMQRAMVGRFLVGAVARAMKPGCKLDTALVLVGSQGAKKSTFFSEIFGEFFADSPIPIGSKDAPIMMSRVWGYEAAELEDLTSKRSAESVKQFMGSSKDLYRPPFARTAILAPRAAVLCGSINPAGRGGAAAFLTDPSGSRRFWILTVPDSWIIPIALLRELRDRIWSEALGLYESGEKWWFDREEDAVREEDAQQYTEEDAWQAKISDWLSTGPGLMGDFRSSDVMSGIGLETSQLNRAAFARVRVVLVRLGWTELPSPAGFRGLRIWRKLKTL